MTKLLIVGQISSKEEAREVMNIAKIVIVGNRARTLAQEA